jgi:hypothetical protein
MSAANGFTPQERRLLDRLSTPEKVQRFLDEEICYNNEREGATCRSPRRVMRDRLGQCMEGALFAAAALSHHGHPPLLVDLEAVRDDDHVLAVYRRRGLWGAAAKSNYSGLRFREPVYRTIRELVMSYFEHYSICAVKDSAGLFPACFPGRVQRTRLENIRSKPMDYCKATGRPAALRYSRHTPSGLTRMDRRLFEAGRLGAVK